MIKRRKTKMSALNILRKKREQIILIEEIRTHQSHISNNSKIYHPTLIPPSTSPISRIKWKSRTHRKMKKMKQIDSQVPSFNHLINKSRHHRKKMNQIVIWVIFRRTLRRLSNNRKRNPWHHLKIWSRWSIMKWINLKNLMPSQKRSSLKNRIQVMISCYPKMKEIQALRIKLCYLVKIFSRNWRKKKLKSRMQKTSTKDKWNKMFLLNSKRPKETKKRPNQLSHPKSSNRSKLNQELKKMKNKVMQKVMLG